ncbi:MAG: KpsF/GutQ family sugar-phosphate isomerase [Chlamydiales bacterium]|nr:KpsF/GutQ family sugar-phosphate isomerase [Chlamydiales bacterium]
MIKELFNEQRRYLNTFFDQIDAEQAQAFLDACLQCRGLIVFTGVGKSGIIAEKIATTLVSTGTKALHLPPTNFLHGDLGMMTSDDMLILISKSGETEELLTLLPFARRRGVKLLSIVSNPHSRLARESDLSISLPVEKELCPFDLAPTTSTEVQLIFGDALAIAMMKAKEFSLNEYALNHPSGNIGKKATLSVNDIMIKEGKVPLCGPDDRLVDTLVELSNKQCGCLLVVDEKKKLLGIFTDGDLRRALQSQGANVLERKMQSLMTAAAIRVPQNILAWDAVKIMQKDPKKWVMVVPVVDDERVVGIIRMHDVVQAGLA